MKNKKIRPKLGRIFLFFISINLYAISLKPTGYDLRLLKFCEHRSKGAKKRLTRSRRTGKMGWDYF